MIRLLKYLKFYKKESILGPLLKLLEATLELLVPLVISAVIDYGINGTAGSGYIVRMCLLLVLLGAAGLGFSVVAQYFAAKAAVGFTAKVRFALFKHIQEFSDSELDALGTSTMVTRLTSDMNQVQNGLNLTLRLLLRSPFVVLGSMVMAFTIDTRLALIFAVVIPVLAAVVFTVMFLCVPMYRKVQQKLDRVLSATRETLNGVRVIRAFCREEEEIKRFRERSGDLTRAQIFTGRIAAVLNPLTYVIINLAVIFLIWKGAIRVEAGLLTQGALIALYNYTAQILTELIKLANLIISVTKSVACGNRIQAILEIVPSQKSGAGDPADEQAPAVEFENVSLCYGANREPSIAGISFQAAKGEVIGIIGGTGAGKTSIVHLIPRFYDATEGVVKVFGADVKSYSFDALREKIGVVPQHSRLFQGTIRENLQWGNKEASDEELLAAAQIAQALELIQQKGGLDSAVEQNGRNFSGGQRQRLTIARALVKKPKILILDDSSSALDYATDAALRRALKSLQGVTVFLVSQRTASIRHADKILVLEDGRIAAFGTHESLLRESPLYREIYSSQVKEAKEA